MKRLFVGNLPYNATDADMQELFACFGEVNSAKIITDKLTGRSRGFGFVEMQSEPAVKAIEELNDSDYGGRKIRVSEAHEREQRNRFNDKR